MIALNLKSSMGTVIHERQVKRMEDMIDRMPSTSKISIGGKRLKGLSPLDGFDLDGGAFFAPTIVEDVSTNDELWKEEVFGPLLVVKRFKVSGIIRTFLRR